MTGLSAYRESHAFSGNEGLTDNVPSDWPAARPEFRRILAISCESMAWTSFRASEISLWFLTPPGDPLGWRVGELRVVPLIAPLTEFIDWSAIQVKAMLMPHPNGRSSLTGA